MSSRMESIRNSSSICGTKPMTAPTPAMMPSQTSPTSQSATLPSMRPRAPSTAHSLTSTSLVQSVRKVPSGPMAIQYTAAMTTTKMGRAAMRFVTMRSMRSEAVILSPLLFFFTAEPTTRAM